MRDWPLRQREEVAVMRMAVMIIETRKEGREGEGERGRRRRRKCQCKRCIADAQ